jgi:hypothetical protein
LTARRACAAIPVVPEYDAFGREIGDDPLASLRDAVNPPPPKPKPVEAAVAEPQPEPVVAAPAPPRLEFVRPRRRGSGRGLAGLLVVAAIVGAVGLAGSIAVQKGEDFIENITPDEAAPPPAGLQGRSLIVRANFAPALKALREAKLGRPLAIRVAPERIDATLVKSGTIHQVQITPDGELRELGSGDASGTRRVVAYAAIDPGAPERLTRAGATRKQPARSINYVLLTPGPPPTWGAYYKRGRIVIGDRHGRPQRVI